jgi:5-methylcytosine-specific restriction endonuclease McrA
MELKTRFKFVDYLRTVRMTKPRLEFEAKEVKFELVRRVARDEREWVNATLFLASNVWTRLRYDILEAKDHFCKSCGGDGTKGGGLNVDHKRNRRDYPQLALLWGNLQLLCGACNKGKGNRYNTDWEQRRPSREPDPLYTPSDEVRAQLNDLAPDWDHDELLSAYRRFCRRKTDQVVRNPDKAFLGWVGKVTKGLPPPSSAGQRTERRSADQAPRAGASTARITGRRRPFGGRK